MPETFDVAIEKRKMKKKLTKSMVQNPLYARSGPQYEVVSPQLDSSAHDQFARPIMDETRVTHTNNQHYDTINAPRFSSLQDTPTTDTSHNHVSQPAHRLSEFHISSNACSPPYEDIMSRSTSSSVPAPSLMGRKKNGQERNKLHLTLSLENANPTVCTTAPWNNYCEIMASESGSDNLAIQNPPDLRHINSMNARNEILV